MNAMSDQSYVGKCYRNIQSFCIVESVESGLFKVQAFSHDHLSWGERFVELSLLDGLTEITRAEYDLALDEALAKLRKNLSPKIEVVK